MFKWGEATLGSTIALLVSANTKMPGVVSVSGFPPIWTLALSKSVIEFCKVNPSTEVAVAQLLFLENSFQKHIFWPRLSTFKRGFILVQV